MAASTTDHDEPWALYEPDDFVPALAQHPGVGFEGAQEPTAASWRTSSTYPAATNAPLNYQYPQSYAHDQLSGLDPYQVQVPGQYHQHQQQHQQHQHEHHQHYYTQHHGFQTRGPGVPFPGDAADQSLPAEYQETQVPPDFTTFSGNEVPLHYFPGNNPVSNAPGQFMMPTTLPIRHSPNLSSPFRPPVSQHDGQGSRAGTGVFYHAAPTNPPPNFQPDIESRADTLLYDGRAAVDRGPNFVSLPLTPESNNSDPTTPPAQWVYYRNQFTGRGLTEYPVESLPQQQQQIQYQTVPVQGFRPSHFEAPASMSSNNPPFYTNTYQVDPQPTSSRTGSINSVSSTSQQPTANRTGSITSSKASISQPSTYQTNLRWVEEEVTAKASRNRPSISPVAGQGTQAVNKSAKSAKPAKPTKSSPTQGQEHEHGHVHAQPPKQMGQWMVMNINSRDSMTLPTTQPAYHQDPQFWSHDPNVAVANAAPSALVPHAHNHAHPHPHPHPHPTDQSLAPDGSADLKAVTRRPKRRTGPLSRAARDKADFLRLLGACWRCRRYRKSCNDAEICDTCLTTTEFRLWPSELGCRRGQLEDLAEPLLPKNAELAFSHLDMSYKKRPNWRMVRFNVPNHDFTEGDRYQKILWMTMGTRLFGDEFIEFFDIVVNYQKVFKNVLVDAACGHLMATCSFYHAFIATDAWFPDPDFAQIMKDFRSHSSVLWKTYLRMALSGRRSDWFPLFLASILTLLSVVICTDAENAMPESLRNEIWDDLPGSIMGLRAGIYIVSLNLLHILTKGVKPWKLPVWKIDEIEQPDGTILFKRNEEGMRLLNNDEAAFDCVVAFRKWLDKYEDVIIHDGKIWFNVKPFTKQELRPIGVLSRMLDLK